MNVNVKRPVWLITLGWFEGRESVRATNDKQEALRFYRDGYPVMPVPTA